MLAPRGSDTIILDQARFASVTSFAGGGLPNARWDELVLRGATFDFTGRTVTGIDRITLQTDGALLIAPTKEIALLASGYASQDDRLEATGVNFETHEIATLHRRGIDVIVDGSGEHVNLAPTFQHLHGDRLNATVAQTVHVDAGSNGLVSDADEVYALLAVEAPRGFDAPGRLGIDTTGVVTLVGGYAAGSLVQVGGIEIGMLWEAGDAGLNIAFNGANANSVRVTELLRAITFTTADTLPHVSAEQLVTIIVADEGGRRTSATVTIEQEALIEGPEILLSHAHVRELAQDGALIGLLTARVNGIGDNFTFTLIDDAQDRFRLEGDKLQVRSGARLDYETNRSHQIKVRATGPDGVSFEQTFTITIDDLADETGTSVGNAGGGRGVSEGANQWRSNLHRRCWQR